MIENNGTILLADDEKTFLDSTGELLRREGYECDCVPDANQALKLLKRQPYDLLIADIKMPGNPDLELIKELPNVSKGTQVILVTAYPSTKSAIESIQLPVSAYMVKPIDFEQLKEKTAIAIKQKNLFDNVTHAKDRLEEWKKLIESLEETVKHKDEQTFSTSLRSFLDITCTNISASLLDLKNITQILTKEKSNPSVCNLINCPKLNKLTEGVNETIKTLELTKSSFKSKELGELRIELEKLVKNNKNL
jgi:DNA-binding response OmpR family regulator